MTNHMNSNDTKNIALVGLGVMGKNLALNLVDNGYNVHVYNRTSIKSELLSEISPKIFGYPTLKNLIDGLTEAMASVAANNSTNLVDNDARIVMLMVPAGQVVDEVLCSLDGLLDSNDIVVDGGNSYYKDTIRRISEHKYNFVGCGISGGEYGARHGPSIMIGCKVEVYESIKGIFESISAKFDSKPCCGWMRENGAGHFVKIVHNGIEYCEMELLQEIYNVFAHSMDQPKKCSCTSKQDVPGGQSMSNNEAIGRVFDKWNKGRLSGYLIEICKNILNKKNQHGCVIDQILDKAEQKGTGKMCVEVSVENCVEVNAIVESVFARFISNQKDKRIVCSNEFTKIDRSKAEEDITSAEKDLCNLCSKCSVHCKCGEGEGGMKCKRGKCNTNTKCGANDISDNAWSKLENCYGIAEETVEKAFYLCKAISYIQGSNLLLSAKAINNWSYTIPQVCDVWKNGCILRCTFLDVLKEISATDALETSSEFLKIYEECYESLKLFCSYAIENDIYSPVFSSCLMWINGLKMDGKNGSLLQAMRDYFGRHGILNAERKPLEIDWE